MRGREEGRSLKQSTGERPRASCAAEASAHRESHIATEQYHSVEGNGLHYVFCPTAAERRRINTGGRGDPVQINLSMKKIRGRVRRRKRSLHSAPHCNSPHRNIQRRNTPSFTSYDILCGRKIFNPSLICHIVDTLSKQRAETPCLVSQDKIQT
ncbi:hypothetical protein RR46_14676 [Papilio xuthus]|uniref:Uncharacterized protein n=1 Tax=Papilio xuthus TaxID=66420 RepID=A0A194PD60_PAPXU|nr:hypothetical protein RR46_14676 [Papilio xuthus]